MFPSSHCPFRQVPKGSTLATGLEEKLNHATHQERTLMMNKMTEEEGAACMHNVQCTTQTWFATPHAAAFSPWWRGSRKEGRGREREERKAAAPFHYMLRPQPRQEASHSSPPPSAQREQEREGGRRRFANLSLSLCEQISNLQKGSPTSIQMLGSNFMPRDFHTFKEGLFQHTWINLFAGSRDLTN